jgi:hypothetical protein
MQELSGGLETWSTFFEAKRQNSKKANLSFRDFAFPPLHFFISNLTFPRVTNLYYERLLIQIIFL